MLDVFWNLPEVQQIAVLTEWLRFPEFVRLHSAVCNKQNRTELNALIRSSMSIFHYYPNENKLRKHSSKDDGLEWSARKGVKLRDIKLVWHYLVDELRRRNILVPLGPTVASITLNLFRPFYFDSESEHYMSGRGCFVDLPPVLTNLLRTCPRLKHLTLRNADCSEYYQAMIEYVVLSTLESVCFKRCSSLPLDLFVALSRSPTLRVVDAPIWISSSVLVPPELVEASAASPSKVHTLTLFQNALCCVLFPHVVNLSINVYSIDDLETITQSCRLVQTAYVHFNYLEVNTETMDAISANWHHISALTLDVPFDRYIAEEIIVHLIKHCPSLICLTRAPTDSTVRYPVGYAGSKLQALDIMCHKADTLRSIITMCPYLHTLLLTRSCALLSTTNVGNMDYAPLEQHLGVITDKCSVKYLQLRRYNTMRSSDILQLQCTNIAHLRISYADHVTNEAMEQLVKRLPFLHTLELVYCTMLTHEIVTSICSTSESLRSLTYDNNHLGRIKMFAKDLFPHMTHFNVLC